jgi:hypothetical protein
MDEQNRHIGNAMKPGVITRSNLALIAVAWAVLSPCFAPAFAARSALPRPSFSSAPYLNPNTGRFWTRDSYEGSSQDPLSLHKYLYCHSDPVNGTDPSGHEYNLITLNVANYQQQNMRTSHGAGLSAGRATALNKIGTSIGVTAWLLMNFMDVGEVQFETALPQIPNQEQEEYKELRDPALGFQQYGQCVEYAEKVSQRRSRGRPLFVAYRLKPQYSFNPYAPWGSILSRLSGQRVADNGFHVGVVILGNVFDNYYSNVPLMTWPLLYEVIRPKIGVDNTVTLMRAHGEGFGQLKLFRDAPPRSRYDPRWDSASSDVIDVPVIE